MLSSGAAKSRRPIQLAFGCSVGRLFRRPSEAPGSREKNIGKVRVHTRETPKLSKVLNSDVLIILRTKKKL